jgi:integrase
MARLGKPWWWDARKCWATTVSGKRITAPKAIGKRDRLEAELWYDRVAVSGCPVALGGITVGNLVGAYLAWRAVLPGAEPRDLVSKRSLFKTLCNTRINHKLIGEYFASEIKEEHVDAVVRAWARVNRSPGYQRTAIALWKAAWSWGHRRIVDRNPVQLLPDNPLVRAITPAGPVVEERYAERAEAAAWLRWLWRNPKVGRDFVLIQRCLIHTGARPSEWTRASWSDIQWDAVPMPILVRTDWKLARKKGKPRRVYIPPMLERALRRRQGAPGDPLFVTPRDKTRWSCSNLATTTMRFRDEAQASGIGVRVEGANRLTCYRWRHTAASNLLMRGVDTATVAELLGTSVLMIQKHYGHLLSGHLAAAARMLASK